jgi:lipopolysaccharide/colanic/teichoic acid biosynthesis glycosyltransferase
MYNLSRYNFYLQSAIDLLSMVISFAVTMWWKVQFTGFVLNDYYKIVYQRLLLVNVILYLVIAFLFLHKNDFVGRTTSEELAHVFKTVAGVMVIFALYVFVTKTGALYSRGFVIVYTCMFGALSFTFRVVTRKKLLPMFRKGKEAERLAIIGPYNNVKAELESFVRSRDWRYKVVGLVVTDRDMKGEYIDNIEVISNSRDMYSDLRVAPADSLMLAEDERDKSVEKFIKTFGDLGKTVHVSMEGYKSLRSYVTIMDEIGNSQVLSYYPVVRIPRRAMIIKRLLDILIALLFLPLYLLILTPTAIITKLGTKGPVIINRVRVGRNGRRFYQHRFRILRTDAEERKETGKSPYTIWGRFLHATHFDGLPMVLNILSADMSLVGPKAPTMQEFIQDIPAKRQNLSIKPGIIGRWACEEDEEKAVRLERDYIEDWGFLKDLVILGKMVLRYLTFHSLRQYGEVEFAEESGIIADYFNERLPLQYDHDFYKVNASLGYRFIKRLGDIVFSLIMIVVLSPLLLILMLLVFLGDGGNPFYAHKRIGYKGERIRVYKFRSMRQDAGDLKKLLTPEQLEQYRREFKIDDDPRITKIGNVLRKTSLDELPQLFNILGGSLSLVGPRPIVEKETQIYGDQIGKLLSVKPGLTGYWQAYARNNATYESGERQEMEMYYVDHCGVWMDIKILFKTVGSVLKKEGAK